MDRERSPSISEQLTSEETILLRDMEGEKQYQVSIEYARDPRADIPDHVKKIVLSTEKGSFALLSEMGIDPENVHICFVEDEAPRIDLSERTTVYSYNPDSPFKLLALMHELAHAQQEQEFAADSVSTRSTPAREIGLSLHLLKKMGVEVDLPEEVIDSVYRLHREMLQQKMNRHDSNLDSGDMEKEHAIAVSKLDAEYEELLRKYPVLSDLEAIADPLLEREAHGRVNRTSERIERQLDVKLDFVTNTDRSYGEFDLVGGSIFERVYDVLYNYMENRGLPAAAPAWVICEKIGIPIKDSSLPDELKSLIDTEDFKKALDEVSLVQMDQLTNRPK